MTAMIAYHVLFPKEARRETRNVTFKSGSPIPADSYALIDHYCSDPECDCQAVLLQVWSKRQRQPVARLVYQFGLEKERDLPHTELLPGSQAPYAKILLAWLTKHLREDPSYAERLRRHYRQVKEAVADPNHPAHARYQAWLASQPAESAQAGADEVRTVKRRRARVTPSAGAEPTVPKSMQARYGEIVALTDRFSEEQLDAEYRDLARQMAAALARKRPSPLSTSKANVWAAGIIYALGQVNFLFDRTQQPHLTPDEIGAGFGVSKRAAADKARQIRDLLRVGVWDPKWTRPSQLGRNPNAWMISVNGLIVDVRYAPREIQEAAYRKGLIPYIPGDPDRLG